MLCDAIHLFKSDFGFMICMTSGLPTKHFSVICWIMIYIYVVFVWLCSFTIHVTYFKCLKSLIKNKILNVEFTYVVFWTAFLFSTISKSSQQYNQLNKIVNLKGHFFVEFQIVYRLHPLKGLKVHLYKYCNKIALEICISMSTNFPSIWLQTEPPLWMETCPQLCKSQT